MSVRSRRVLHPQRSHADSIAWPAFAVLRASQGGWDSASARLYVHALCYSGECFQWRFPSHRSGWRIAWCLKTSDPPTTTTSNLSSRPSRDRRFPSATLRIPNGHLTTAPSSPASRVRYRHCEQHPAPTSPPYVPSLACPAGHAPRSSYNPQRTGNPRR